MHLVALVAVGLHVLLLGLELLVGSVGLLLELAELLGLHLADVLALLGLLTLAVGSADCPMRAAGCTVCRPR